MLNLEAQALRNTALDGAVRVSPPGTPNSTVLSRAREFEVYLALGIIHSGKDAGTTIHVGDLAVTICAPPGKLSPGRVEQLRSAIEDAL